MVRKIIGGGVTPASGYRHPAASIEALHRLGTFRLRLINVDKNLLRVSSKGDLIIKWRGVLRPGLKLCKKHGFIPRLIIGQSLQKPLALKGERGRIYGPSSWDVYRRYVKEFLIFVTKEWGFEETEWEVGNEMNIPKFNWVAAKKPKGGFDEAGFLAYMKLYRNISMVVHEFKKEYPGLAVRLGGPAIVMSKFFLEQKEDRNWLFRFVDAVAKEGLVCDFVSFHIYGNLVSGRDLTLAVEKLKGRESFKRIRPKVSISEWGADWRADAEVNFEPLAGAFALDFVRTVELAGVNDTIFLALSEFPTKKWPVLLAKDGSPTHYMHALRLLSEMDGSRLNCSINSNVIGCFAAKKESDDILILLWNLNWWNNRLSQKIPDYSGIGNKIVVTLPSGDSKKRYALDIFKINGEKIDASQTSVRIMLSANDLHIDLTNHPIPHGSYALLRLCPKDLKKE